MAAAVAAAVYEPIQKHKVTISPGIPEWLNKWIKRDLMALAKLLLSLGVFNENHLQVCRVIITLYAIINVLKLNYCLMALAYMLIYCGQVGHICISNLTIIGSDNGLLLGLCQAIIWINGGILFEIPIEVHTFSFKKMHLNRSSAKCQPFCLGLNVLMFHGKYLISKFNITWVALWWFCCW